MNELRDPFERVSNSLRRAVSINKSQETDLRITMSTIQRERRRSVNSWSLKQEKFLRAKQKLMPVFKPENGRKLSQSQSMVTSTRRLTLVRGVSPDSMVEGKQRAKFVSNFQAASQTTVAVTKADSPGNPLPPLIVPGKRTKQSHPEGLKAPVAAICNQLLQEPLGPTESQLRRARRVSDYKAAMSTDGETKSLQRRVRRFTEYRAPEKLGLNEIPERLRSIIEEDGNSPSMSGVKSVSVNINLSRPSESVVRADERQNKSMPRNRLGNLDKIIGDDVSSKRRHTLRDRDNGFGRRLSSLTIQQGVQSRNNAAARDNWKKLRMSLKTVKKRSKPNDVGKMSLIEMTRLFEEIRQCRYLRGVEHNPSTIGGDGAASMGQGCRCLACTVKDKTKLKNNMSAPQ